MRQRFFGDFVSSYPYAWKPLDSTQAAQVDPGPDWQELGSADLNGDGTADTLFRNVNTHEVGFVDGAGNGTTVEPLGTMDDDWSVATLAAIPEGLLKFYGDQGTAHGIANIVWHNATTGAVSIWHVVDGHLQQTLEMPLGGYGGIAAPGVTAGLGDPGAFPEPGLPPTDAMPGFPTGGGDIPAGTSPEAGVPDTFPGATGGGLGGQQADAPGATPGGASGVPDVFPGMAPGDAGHPGPAVAGGLAHADTGGSDPGVSAQAAQALALGPEWEELGSADFDGDGTDDTLVRNTETHEVGFVPAGEGDQIEPLGTIADGLRVAKIAAVPDDLLSFDNFSSIESLVNIAWENEATGAVSIWHVQNGHLEQTLDVPAGGYWGIAEPAAASDGDTAAPVMPGSGLAGPGDWHLSGLA